MRQQWTKPTWMMFLLSLLSLAIASRPSQVTVRKAFEKNRLTLHYVLPALRITEEDTTLRVSMAGAETAAIPGRWTLPTLATRILEGPRQAIDEVQITYSNWDTIAVAQEPQRALQYLPLSMGKDQKALLEVPTYREQGFWPAEESFPASTLCERGYTSRALTLTPVRYNREKNVIIVAQTITVEVSFKKKRERTSLFGNAPTDVVNEGQFSFSTVRRGKGYLAISSKEILSAQTDTTLKDLLAYHKENGFTTYSESTESIAASYTGRDLAEKIRACISDYYTNKGVSFILLAGDTNVVPVRRLYVDDAPASRLDSVPSDIYYQCLDGDFDYDKDGIWGEKNDGVDGGFIDLYAEVSIGRIPAENSVEISHAVAKTLRFYANPSIAKKTLTVGEKLGFGGLSEYSNNFLAEIWSGGTYNNYGTVSFESETGISQKKLLDFEKTWEDDNIADSINSNNYGIINHLGHGYSHLNMRLRTKNVDSLITNNTPLFEYSQACMSGDLDESSIAEALLTTNRHGLWAGVFNSRYGLGSFNSTNAPSQFLHRQFWDAYFGEEFDYLGELNADSHHDAIALAQSIWAYRWVIYTSNLLGDPAANLQLRHSEKKLVPLSPVKGDIWEQERRFDIQWYDNFKEKVTLSLVGTFDVSQPIAKDIPSTQGHGWTIPRDVQPGKYQILFTSEALSEPIFSDTFSIEKQSTIELKNPQGGEKWHKDSIVEIRWHDDVDEPLLVLLMDGESVVDSLHRGTTESSHSWTVPRTLPQSSSYRIRLQSSRKEWFFVESNPLTIQSPSIKNYPYHFSPDSLSLGEDLSYWDQSRSDNFNWKVHKGQTPSKKQPDDWWNATGPSKDASGSGHYIYAEATGNSPSKKATMLSPIFDISGLKNGKVSFKYHLFCKEDFGNMGNLTLNIYIDGELHKNVAKISGSKGDAWKEKIVDLADYSGHEMRLEFVATTGKSFASDMALDDIKVSGESKNALPQFISTPVTKATVGKEYLYTVIAEDDDGSEGLAITVKDGLSWLQCTDKGSGKAELIGTPTLADTGAHVITLETADPITGEAVTQEFTLTVELQTSSLPFEGVLFNGLALAPRILSDIESTLSVKLPVRVTLQRVHLFDITGNAVYQKELQVVGEFLTLDMSSFIERIASGTYLLVLETVDTKGNPQYAIKTIAVKRAQ